MAGIMDAGKARYGTRRTQVTSVPQRKNPLSIEGCFNCDDSRHMLRDFPLPRNTAKEEARKLDYFKKKKALKGVQMVLSQGFHQMDCSVEKVHEDDEYAEILSEIIADVTRET